MPSHDPPPIRSVLETVASGAFIEGLYETYKRDPSSLGEDWIHFFQGFELAMCPRPCVAADRARAQSQVASLIYAYRDQGHLIARLDPLGSNRREHPDLALDAFGFKEDDLDTVFDTGHLGGPSRAPLREILSILTDTYCRTIGVEYLHIESRAIRRWLQAQMEPERNRPELPREKRRDILERLVDAEIFETFLQSRYPGQKRFSLEGAEALIPALHAAVELAPQLGIREMVLGMAHRGRLNVLANILDKSYAMIFSEFEDTALPDSVAGDGDVKYHRGYASIHVNRRGKPLHVSLTSNPSHLEAVSPVVLGRTRAKQRRLGDMEHRRKVLPFLVHGDAAFSGQGIVAETLNLSGLPGYTVGGTIHFIVNNQIGFTTSPEEGRSTVYPTDAAKMIQAPIFHVNGDDPEAVVTVTELALRFRQTFGRDAVVDMVCYRRHGHNEGDEPAFTHPLLYKTIKEHPSVRELYIRHLAECCGLASAEEAAMRETFKKRLQEALDGVRSNGTPVENHAFEGRWKGLDNSYSHASAATGASHELLKDVAKALTTIPEGFTLNPKIARRLPGVMESVETMGTVDWPTAELLAFGSLLHEGSPVRLSGQDSARGTFSQRHSVWRDAATQEAYAPLKHIRPGQATFCVYNSMLSEAAVLGFDYGYSLEEPHMLVLWEAQFGDFSNGAQVIIDQFIVSSLSKWQRASGIVLLLPHGYEGQGPEHSNAYLDRWLAACAEDNIQVCNPTTPAQYFHALRRQLKRPFRRPLVLMAPKSLLRHPAVVSPVSDLIEGRFREVLPDPRPPERVKRVVLCSGKLYYDILRSMEKTDETALVRVEQFYPFPEKALSKAVGTYGEEAALVWAQEEPENRGGWGFIAPRLSKLFPGRSLRYAGRRASASPAPGSHRQHLLEQEGVVSAALGRDESSKQTAP